MFWKSEAIRLKRMIVAVICLLALTSCHAPGSFPYESKVSSGRFPASSQAVHDFLSQSKTAVFKCANQSFSLPYRIYIPKDFALDKSYPLLLFLHGSGARGNDNTAQAKDAPILDKLTDNTEYPCILLAPQCPKNGYWSDAKCWRNSSGVDILAVVKDLISSLRQQYRIDPSRIYITGYSMGGFGTYGMIAKYPALFACAVPCAGWGDESNWPAKIRTPVWAFHGESDDNIPAQLDKNMEYLIKKDRGKIKLICYPGIGHNCWDKAYNEPYLIPWIFSKSHDIKA